MQIQKSKFFWLRDRPFRSAISTLDPGRNLRLKRGNAPGKATVRDELTLFNILIYQAEVKPRRYRKAIPGRLCGRPIRRIPGDQGSSYKAGKSAKMLRKLLKASEIQIPGFPEAMRPEKPDKNPGKRLRPLQAIRSAAAARRKSAAVRPPASCVTRPSRTWL